MFNSVAQLWWNFGDIFDRTSPERLLLLFALCLGVCGRRRHWMGHALFGPLCVWKFPSAFPMSFCVFCVDHSLISYSSDKFMTSLLCAVDKREFHSRGDGETKARWNMIPRGTSFSWLLITLLSVPYYSHDAGAPRDQIRTGNDEISTTIQKYQIYYLLSLSRLF